MFAIRAERDYVVQEDFMKAVRKVAEKKKLEAPAHTYSKVNYILTIHDSNNVIYCQLKASTSLVQGESRMKLGLIGQNF